MQPLNITPLLGSFEIPPMCPQPSREAPMGAMKKIIGWCHFWSKNHAQLEFCSELVELGKIGAKLFWGTCTLFAAVVWFPGLGIPPKCIGGYTEKEILLCNFFLRKVPG